MMIGKQEGIYRITCKQFSFIHVGESRFMVLKNKAIIIDLLALLQ
jgi:hypothetical protein